MKPEHDSLNREALIGRRVCVTGRLAAMTHGEFAALVADCGGEFQLRPPKGGFLLVIGADGWPARGDGSPSTMFERARKLRAYGYPIEFLAEEEFFGRIGLSTPSAALRRRHSISDLTRILGVSAASVRRWARLGLICPVETVHRYSFFSFAEVASARRLCELISGGASLDRIRQGLEQFKTWLPAASVSFSQLSLLEQDGKLLLRLNNALVEPSGQRHFDFESPDEAPQALEFLSRRPAEPDQLDELFDRGLVLEDQRRFDEAAEAYRRASELAPDDAVVHFNLGNVLFAAGRFGESLESYRESLRCDPNYAEAWNNLGNVLCETGDLRDAVRALRRAVELVPDYADAQHNLASVLEILKPASLSVIS